MRRAPWWAVASAALAPILLVGGWTIAASLQPPGYDPIGDTISDLAAQGATDRWVMTAALAGVGVCYVLSAVGLFAARAAGRFALAIGGLATLCVAAFPQPAHGNSVDHTLAASVAFSALALWPVVATRRSSEIYLLTPAASVTATVVMVGLALWFVLELHGGHRGLAERSAALAESVWPCAVVVGARLGSLRSADLQPPTSAAHPG